ncbi:Hypothetical protein A7982_08053 [Minicystis rosea]|nr:Hypothetical protein A7982_08053 [Minicystis rosea]
MFAEYCAWASVLGEGLGGAPDEIDAALRVLRDEVAAQIEPAPAAAALALLDAGRARLRVVPVVTPASLAVIPKAPAAPPGHSAAAALDAAAARLAAMSVVLGFMRRPARAIAYGEQRFRCLEDAGFHIAQLVAAVSEDQPELFAEYAEWAESVLVGAGLPADELVHHLGELSDTLDVVLPPHLAAPARRIVAAAIDRLRRGPSEIRSFLDREAPLGDLAHQYLSALFEGRRHDACSLVQASVEAGVPVREVYARVFQPCQYELGRLWQKSEISIAQEHYCTAVTQLCMSQLSARAERGERTGRRLLSACAGGNLHEIGARFVSDFFEMAGWDTRYLGASTPADHLVREVVAWKVDVLAVSATLVSHVRAAREIVEAVHAHPACRNVAVVLGGYPFRVVRDLALRMGADGSASDAEGAVELAKGLLAARG